MELGTPRSESHHCAVVVRLRANGSALILARARDGIGTDHLRAVDIEQEDLAREPVGEIPRKRTYRGTISRYDGRSAEPATRTSEVDHSLIGGPVKLVDIEVETVSDKHVPVARDPVKDVTGAGTCDTE